MVRSLFIFDAKGNRIPRVPSKVYGYSLLKLSSEKNSLDFKCIVQDIIADLQEAMIFGETEAASELARLYDEEIRNLDNKDLLGYNCKVVELYNTIYERLSNHQYQQYSTTSSPISLLADKYVNAIKDNKLKFGNKPITKVNLQEAVKHFKDADDTGNEPIINIFVNDQPIESGSDMGLMGCCLPCTII